MPWGEGRYSAMKSIIYCEVQTLHVVTKYFVVSVEPKTGHNLSEPCFMHQNCEINFCEER